MLLSITISISCCPFCRFTDHTSGAAIDWVHDSAKVKYAMVIELRDKGQFGFILPNEFIIPSGMELVQGFRHLIDHLERRGEVAVKHVTDTAAW